MRTKEQWRFRSLMVDEFQDTNRLQCELVDLLAGEAVEELFFVGDEFQSIYRFRHADVNVFRERRAQSGGVFALTQNYRSRPEVLAAVKHQQHPAGRKRLQEDFEDRPLSLLAHATGGGDRQLEKACIQDGRELDEEDAVAMSLDEVSGEAQRQPGFARAAGPCQGDQSRAVEQAPQLGQLRLAADEAADRGWEIVWRGHGGRGDDRALYELSPMRWPIPG